MPCAHHILKTAATYWCDRGANRNILIRESYLRYTIMHRYIMAGHTLYFIWIIGFSSWTFPLLAILRSMAVMFIYYCPKICLSIVDNFWHFASQMSYLNLSIDTWISQDMFWLSRHYEVICKRWLIFTANEWMCVTDWGWPYTDRKIHVQQW